jgi:predicted RNase H-like HicB family nuclease
MKPKYSMVIRWSDEDDAYLVHLPEFPNQQFVTHGDTYEEAAKHGQEVLEMFIEALTDEGKPLPHPDVIDLNQELGIEESSAVA